MPLKVHQIKPLFKLYSIQVKTNLSKEKVRIDKAFLTDEGKKLVDERKKDFENLFEMKSMNSYLFTSKSDHTKPLCRETITRQINSVLASVSKSLPDQPNITSNNFRTGYISELWEDSKNGEFVKQAFGAGIIEYRSSNGGRFYFNLNGEFVTCKKKDQ